MALKNITFSAEEAAVAAARKKAIAQNTTLNAEFRRWLDQYVDSDAEGAARVAEHDRVMAMIHALKLRGPKLTREEMNER